MKVLLDTCTFLWIIAGASELTTMARSCFADADNEIYLSAVSGWEIAVKHGLGRLPLPEPPARFVPAERKRHLIRELPLDEAAVLGLERVPHLHRDPFDRMLVCQAVSHGMTLLTPDPDIARYPVNVVWWEA